jgi:predicted RNA-binding Zn-ribbon protein involved in translation (DUF1610 family)
VTGEDAIIKAAAALLRVGATVDTVVELRLTFWWAGRCEHCGTVVSDEEDHDLRKCPNCDTAVINRGREALARGHGSEP